MVERVSQHSARWSHLRNLKANVPFRQAALVAMPGVLLGLLLTGCSEVVDRDTAAPRTPDPTAASRSVEEAGAAATAQSPTAATTPVREADVAPTEPPGDTPTSQAAPTASAGVSPSPVVDQKPGPTAKPPSLPSVTPTPSPAQPSSPQTAGEATSDQSTPTAGAVAVVESPLTKMVVEQAFPGVSFQEAVHLTYPEDGSNRLFLVLQPGRIMAFENDQSVSSVQTFLDISMRVNNRGNEEGLLGMAFDPEYRDNGYFYVYYSASPPRRSVVSRFAVSAADPNLADWNSEVVVLEVPQPFSNHNGGHLLFGPDGYLYIGLGDGGSGGDPDGNGQNASTLLGAILRIDVSVLGREGTYRIPPDNPFSDRADVGRPEVWAYGLRNPWRFTFDRQTGELWAADVGQNRFEEVDIILPGRNYGWNIMEGAHCFRDASCDQEGLEQPVAEYGRAGGCSITGGYVFRGERLPSLHGAYVYGDFCSGKIWALRYDSASVTEHIELVESPLNISAFGEDQSGELYILSYGGGIYRLAPTSER